MGIYKDKKFVKEVKPKKVNWRIKFNEMESEKDEKAIEILLNEIDIREERVNRLIADLYELDFIFENEDDSNKDKRNYEKVEKSSEVYTEVFSLVEEIGAVLRNIEKKLQSDTKVLTRETACIVNYLKVSVKEYGEYMTRINLMLERNVNFIKLLNNYSKIWADRFVTPYIDLMCKLNRMNEDMDNELKKSNLSIEEKKSFKEGIKNYKSLMNNKNMNKYLESFGYTYKDTGRHDNYENENGHKIPVPNHGKDMGIGLTKAIIKEVEIGAYK